jgi:hypothetical protein
MYSRPTVIVLAVALPAVLLPTTAGSRTAPCNPPKIRAGSYCVNVKTSNVRGFVQLAYVKARGGRKLAVISAKVNGPFNAPCTDGTSYRASNLFFYGGFSYNSAFVHGSSFSLHMNDPRGFARHFTGRFISNTKAVISWSETVTPAPGKNCTISASNVTV